MHPGTWAAQTPDKPALVMAGSGCTLAYAQRYQVTHTQMAPTMFVRMPELPDDVRSSYDVSSPDRSRVLRVHHNDPERTASTQHPEHQSWTTVGDLGYLDEDGYLLRTDRKAFMIISGGVTICPQEIEDLFSLHPAVTDVAVIGVPDDEMGEQVVAFVEIAPCAAPTPELAAELTAYAHRQDGEGQAARGVRRGLSRAAVSWLRQTRRPQRATLETMLRIS